MNALSSQKSCGAIGLNQNEKRKSKPSVSFWIPNDFAETVKEIAEIEMCKFELWELYQGEMAAIL